ncbi:hypothetical protein JXB37_06240, partial [candidate division WOR-3 bacterium]|nr:hypothetical protein [candidate division WOR-3 bacterium]
MMRLMLLVAALLAVAPAQVTFMRTYGDTADEEGLSVAQTEDGGYVVAGHTGSYGAGRDDVWVIRIESRGDTLWTMAWGGADHDRARWITQTEDGGYIVAGETWSYGAGSYDVWLIKTDRTGGISWTQTYGGTSEDRGYSASPTSDGGYIVVGSTWSYGVGNMDAWLVKTNSLGDTLWTRSFGGPAWDWCHSVVQTRNGGYALAGCTGAFGAGAPDAWLIRTDAAGDTLWTRTYGGMDWDEAATVVQTQDGGFAIICNTESLDDETWLIRTDSLGDTLWTRTYGSPSDDFARSLLQSEDGCYIITGFTQFGPGGANAWLVKIDPAGDTVWTRTFGGSSWDWGHSAAQTQDGGYVVTGFTHSYGAGGSDVWLIKTDSLGLVGIAEPEPPGPVTRVEATVF